MFKFTTLVASVILVSACSATPTEPTTTTADANAVRCVRETPTGTNIPTTRCRTPEQIAAEREAGRAAADSIRRTPTGVIGSDGK